MPKATRLAMDQARPIIQQIRQQIAESTMSIGHQNVAGTGIETPANRRIGFGRHQPTRVVIVNRAGPCLLGPGNACDTFDINRNENTHLITPSSSNHASRETPR
jgi:hypothetical protein